MPCKLVVVVHACNPRTKEVETGIRSPGLLDGGGAPPLIPAVGGQKQVDLLSVRPALSIE